MSPWGEVVLWKKAVFRWSVPNTTGLWTHTPARTPKVGAVAVTHALLSAELRGSWCSCTNYGLISEFGHGWPSRPGSVNIPESCCNRDLAILSVCLPCLMFPTLAPPPPQVCHQQTETLVLFPSDWICGSTMADAELALMWFLVRHGCFDVGPPDSGSTENFSQVVTLSGFLQVCLY